MVDLPSRVSCDVPLDEPGKHYGHLRVPYPRNTSAWGSLQVPIVVVAGGKGPTVLATAGQHGDEFEGPMALAGMCRDLDPGELRGTLIALPAVNVTGLAASTRLATADQRDPNRSYPGQRAGSPTEMLCHWIDTVAVERADFVLDLHSGGRSLEFVPSIMMHPVADDGIRARSRKALEAFGAPVGLVIEERDLVGSLDERVEGRGTPFLFAELGGGGRVTPASMAVARVGIRNLLGHLGLIDGVGQGARTAQILDASGEGCFVHSPELGALEPTVELGESVSLGQTVARIHDLAMPERAPLELSSGTDGVVVGLRAMALTDAGDTVALVAREDGA